MVSPLAHLIPDLHDADRLRAERDDRHLRVSEDVEVGGEDGRGLKSVFDGLSGVHDPGGRLDVSRDSVRDENGVGSGEKSSRSGSGVKEEGRRVSLEASKEEVKEEEEKRTLIQRD